MEKHTLQKLTLGVIAGAVMGFIGFAVHQLRIDAQAQSIVRHNANLVTELGAIKFQNQSAEAGQIRLIFPSLFKARKHSLDIFRATYPSYVESEIRNLILEVIAS
jgi:hypothetical protein